MNEKRECKCCKRKENKRRKLYNDNDNLLCLHCFENMADYIELGQYEPSDIENWPKEFIINKK